jgi:hypothetical protein
MYKDPSRDATEQPKRPCTTDKVQYILCVLSLFKMSLFKILIMQFFMQRP